MSKKRKSPQLYSEDEIKNDIFSFSISPIQDAERKLSNDLKLIKEAGLIKALQSRSDDRSRDYISFDLSVAFLKKSLFFKV